MDMRFRDLADVVWQEAIVSIEGIEREQELKNRLLMVVEEIREATLIRRPTIVRIRLEGRGHMHETLLQPSVAEEWLEELRESLGAPEETEAWIWPESIAVRTEDCFLSKPRRKRKGSWGNFCARE